MDLKTLEYMEERAKKAREIVNKIEVLTKYAERAGQIRGLLTKDQYGNNLFGIPQLSYPDLVKTIRSSIQELINDEIAKLEQELAEL